MSLPGSLTVLALNPGSSSLKAVVRGPQRTLTAQVERMGTAEGTLTLTGGGADTRREFVGGPDDAVRAIGAELAARGLLPGAVAHRVVHGGSKHHLPTVVDDALVADLRTLVPLAPLHLPGDLDSIARARELWPAAVHVACFDTGFHHDLPEEARRLPLPRELTELGMRRYGFHGLSMQSVLHARPDIGQAVVAHLGSGCSITAIAGGRPRHTTMSLTPTGGMVSATRSGDLDPEVVLTLIGSPGYEVGRLRDLLDRESGLRGVSGGRSDLRDLLASVDPDARLAVRMFVRSAAMAVAACAAVLDRWETLVFTGGVGEHAGPVRDLVCERLLALRAPVPAQGGSAVERLMATGVRVLVVPADEEGVLDRETRALLRSPAAGLRDAPAR